MYEIHSARVRKPIQEWADDSDLLTVDLIGFQADRCPFAAYAEQNKRGAASQPAERFLYSFFVS